MVLSIFFADFVVVLVYGEKRINVLNVILPQIYLTNTVRLSFVALVTITIFLIFYNVRGFSKR